MQFINYKNQSNSNILDFYGNYFEDCLKQDLPEWIKMLVHSLL